MKTQRSISIVFVLIFLTASSIIAFQPVKAQFLGSITINADGSVSPSTAPIQQTDNVYTLTSDLIGSITVNRNNTVLEGNGHTITWPSINSGGIRLNDTSNVTIEDFTINGGIYGIKLWGTSNIIINNTIEETGKGAYSIMQPTAAVYVSDASSNIITGNDFVSNTIGISLTSWSPGKCSENQIIENNFTDTSIAFLIDDSSNNAIYHNNFVNSEKAVVDVGYLGFGKVSVNNWDDGIRFGNYWNDYLTKYPNATEIGTSGIGGTPYIVYENYNDHYPLMQPFSSEFYVQATTPPKITLTSPLNQTYHVSNVSLAFSLDKPVKWIGYSLDGAANITILENSTVTNMTDGLHSITVYANDTYGNIGASVTVSFTVAKPEPSPTPSPPPTQTPLPSQQPTQSPEPSTTSISTTEIILVAVVVVITVSIAALAISKRYKRKVRLAVLLGEPFCSAGRAKSPFAYIIAKGALLV